MIDSLITKSQSLDFLDKLEKLKAAKYEKGSFEVKVKKIFGEDLSIKESEIDKLIKEIKERPVVELTLSFEPSEKSLRKIGVWIEQNIEKNVLIDIRVDTGIVGGAVVEYNGKHFDGSWSKRIFNF